MSQVRSGFHPFARATLQKAVRAWLRDHHGHSSHGAMLACEGCVARFWEELAKVAPKGVLGTGPGYKT